MDGLGRVYRFLETFAERSQMTDMVQVIMSHKDCRERTQVKIVLLEYLSELDGADTGIDQKATFLSGQIIAVAAASA
jgi:hypothetical protein